MTDFAAPAALPQIAPLDSTKHVKYTLGMVLGVDDFDQEFAYLSGRDRWLARDTVGYGTVWGLDVFLEEEQAGPRVHVSPGTAITPCGQLVCVSPAQCASLNEWLLEHQADVRARMSSPPGDPLRVYVVLCYRECPTDDMPIPGEPCRTEDTLSAPSRLKDGFRLELRFAPPAQPEEDAIRDFVAWMREIPVVDGPGSSEQDLLEALEEASRGAVAALESPPASPPASPPDPFDLVLGSPPPGLTIPAADLTERLRSALRFWVTDLRPALRRALPGCDCDCGGHGTCGCGCAGDTGLPSQPCDDDVVLLAALEMDVAEGEVLEVASPGGAVLDESRRPYVLHTRMLQEWMLTGALGVAAGSPPSAPASGIADVTAHEVSGIPTAFWDAQTRVLDLGIPRGAGIADVKLSLQGEGTDPTLFFDQNTRIVTIGLGPGRQGNPGDPGDPGKDAELPFRDVAAHELPHTDQPTVEIRPDGVLDFGIPAGEPGPGGGTSAPAGPSVVAAGVFGPGMPRRWSFNDLKAEPIVGIDGLWFLTFDGFGEQHRLETLLIKATAVTSIRDGQHTVEIVLHDDDLERALKRVQREELIDQGFFLRALGNDNESQPSGFHVEITDYTEFAELIDE